MPDTNPGIPTADVGTMGAGRQAMPALRAILVTGVLAWVVAYGVMNNPWAIALFAQSDSLVPADWVHELSRFPGEWRWYKLPQVVSFVPDFVTYPLAQALTGSWRGAMILYAAQMAVTMGVLGGLVAARIGGWSRLSAIAVVSGLLALLFALATLVARSATLNYSPSAMEFPASIWIFVLLPVTHGGPFLLSMFTARWVSGWIFGAGLAARRWQLFGLMAVGVASDGVFIVECVIPLLVVVAIVRMFYAARFDIREFARFAVSGAVAGFILPLLFYHGSLPKIAFAKFGVYLLHWAGDFPALPPVWSGLLLLLLPLRSVLRDYRSRMQGQPSRPDIAAGQFLTLFGIAAAFASLAGCAVMYIDAGIYRYALAWVWWPMILFVGTVSRSWIRQAGWNRHLVTLPAMLAAIVVLAAPPKRADAMSGWHSRAEKCLAGVRALRHLHGGLASYSLARSISASVDFAWQIDQIDERGAPRPWGNDTKAYFRDFDNPSLPPRYDYILVDPTMDKLVLDQVYGRPDHVDDCPLAQVWSWRDPDHVRPLLMANAQKLNRELRRNFLVPPAV